MASTSSSTNGYALLKTINLPGTKGGHGDWLAYDQDTRSVWLAQSPDNNTVVIDTDTNAIKAVIPGVLNSNGLALTPQYAFVADVGNNTVDVIDKRTFQKVGTAKPTGTTPDSTTYVPSTNQVYVASDDNNTEDAIGTAAPFASATTIQLLPQPSADGPDVSTYVASKDKLYQPDQGQVDVIDPHTNTIVATWPILSSGDVKPLVYDPVTNHFLAGTTNNQMLVLDGDTGKVLASIPISGSVDETAIDVGARLAYVGDKAGVVDIINLDTNQLVGDLPAEKGMHTLAVDPTTHEVYVYENNANRVDVFAPVSNIGSGGSSTATVTNGAVQLPNMSQDAAVTTNGENVTVLINNRTVNASNANQVAFIDGTLDVGPNSPAAQVIRLYNAVFGRNPDSGGLAVYANLIQGSGSATTVAQVLLDSPEGQARFAGKGQSSSGFVNQVYQNVFHRDPDSSGTSFFTQALDGGASRAQVAAGIANSAEAQADTMSQIKSGVWLQNARAAGVENLYYAALNRAADSPGLSAYVNAVSNGLSLRDAAQGMVDSAEFTRSYGGLTAPQFVAALYQNFLGRAPDAAGLSNSIAALNNGATKADIVLGFSQSAERQAMHIGTQGIVLNSNSV